MNLTNDRLERLIFVKFLLMQAEKSKNLIRPASSTAILNLHDCVECFLQVAYEHLTGKSKLSGQNILDTYTENINENLQKIYKETISKSYIKRINELRNQLKHSTIFIDQKNILNLFTETEQFLNDFTISIFEISFKKINITELLSNETVKNHLKRGEYEMENGNFQKAIFEIAKAYIEIELQQTNNNYEYAKNPFNRMRRVNYLIKYTARIGGDDPDKVLEENLKEIAEDINIVQEEVNQIKDILLLNVERKDYLRFKAIIPHISAISRDTEKGYETYIQEEYENISVEYKIEDIQFCYDFVLELAIKHYS